MPLFIASLNSGSNGNCYYIGNETDAVLVDAGLSCRETEKRMKLLGLSIRSIKAIFISHEHTDHIKGAPAIAERFSIPIYITKGTLAGCNYIPSQFTKCLTPDDPVSIGRLQVMAFPKIHDACDPHSFTISFNGTTVGVFTDIGSVCDRVIEQFSICHAVFLEANYDEELLEKGSYPFFLKNRIRGGRGHLSNRQALELFMSHRSEGLSHLLLSHLSKDNNCPERAKDLFTTHAGSTEVTVASRYIQTPLYRIEGSKEEKIISIPVKRLRAEQLSIF